MSGLRDGVVARPVTHALAGVDAAVRRRATMHLVLALVGSVVVIMAQLSSWTEVTAVRAWEHGWRAAAATLLGGAFVLVTAMALLRHMWLMAFAWLDAIRTPPRGGPGVRSDWPSVSILIPAHDEAERIERALAAIATLDYPDVEAIVVDDGSGDDTLLRARRFAGQCARARIHVIHKENGGKWSALNLALRHASGELVLCMDADSHLGVDSLKRLAAHFDDAQVGCCAGQVVVRNGDNLLARLQSLEYVMMNALARRTQSWFGTVLVAPGPISMFRRAALEEIARRWNHVAETDARGARVGGPWEHDTFAEDADLSLNLLLTGQRAVYEAAAISYTHVPTTTFALLNQRYRWTRGSLQAALKAWGRWRGDRGAPPALAFWLAVLLFETVAWPLLNFLGFLALGLFVAFFGLNGPLLTWFLALTALDVNAAAFGVVVEGADRRLVALTPINRLYFSVLLDVSRFYALYDELRGTGMRWS